MAQEQQRSPYHEAVAQYISLLGEPDYPRGRIVDGLLDTMRTIPAHTDHTPESAAKAIFSLAGLGRELAQENGDFPAASALRDISDSFGIISGGYPHVESRERIRISPTSGRSETYQTRIYRRPDGTNAAGPSVFIGPLTREDAHLPKSRSLVPYLAGRRVADSGRRAQAA